MIRRGLAEWALTTDAQVHGVDMRRMAYDLIKENLRQGAAELLLLKHVGPRRAPVSGTEALGEGPCGYGARRFPPLDAPAEGLHHVRNPVLGYDVVSTRRGWLEGHQLFLLPEWRGRGLCGAYFDAALGLCRVRGLHGFHFASTLPRWAKLYMVYNFHIGWTYTQQNGVVATGYFREV